MFFLKFGNQNCTAFPNNSYHCYAEVHYFKCTFILYFCPFLLLQDLNQIQFPMQERLAVFVFVIINILIHKTHFEIHRLVT